MTLEALLKLLREGILNDRSDRVSGSSDYLWTDETLVTYINEAQRRFATRGLILRDATSDLVTKITLVAGQRDYPLHKSVIAVLSAKNEEQQADLTRVGHAVLAAYRAPTEQWIDPSVWQGYGPGPSLAYSTDEGLVDIDAGSFTQVNVRIYPVPRTEEDGKVIRLRVLRKPIVELALNALTAEPEIPEDHHLEMLDWAAYLALRIVDDDAGAPKRAAEFAAAFETHVKAARVLVMRKLFTPMGWGFGRGGFTWDR